MFVCITLQNWQSKRATSVGEEMSNPSASLFARELGKCLSIANMRPDEAVTALNDEGYPVPNKTFSYWLQGIFCPVVRRLSP